MRYALLCLVFPLAAVLFQGRARAQTPAPPTTVEIQRLFLGSGEPGRAGYENATLVVNDVFHVPQYLPGWPTARSIWARVVDVPCAALASGGLRCQGYSWTPALGRAEYLYFRPVLAAATPVSSRSDDTAVAGGAAGPVAPPDPAPEPKRE
jgi:hypothetical protein